MIYLDYAAETPVNEEVLKTFYDVSQKYIGNPNSTHALGVLAKARLNKATRHIAKLLKVKENEIIYTSSASESNNLAIKGIAEKSKAVGKHIITTYLEHSSVNGAIASLQNKGYEVDYVDVLNTGLVDLEHLQELLRKDTILVCITFVDSEVGIIQDIDKIGELLINYPHCVFHVDGTQGIGKINISTTNIDLLSFAPHKFYGIGGCGVLIKKENIILEPIIHGGISTTPFRSGTPALPLIVSIEKALSLAILEIDTRYKYVLDLNMKLRKTLVKYPKVRINSTDHNSPYILNISISGTKSEEYIEYFNSHNIYLSSKSACCAVNSPSRPIYAITKNRKAALSTLRISLSHYTTMEEIEIFLKCFNEFYIRSEKREI
ncbi:aminotransferase class V-fold PLP-dependent enzyme [Alkalibaculum sp. M08DMB]|uniref:Aminotransferase class V-fold PLP-dependent enzyme n=1 Tax=Alkalibaculum sporogenes TaxID=2655001 RepID=A0A6A7KD72_9FIRM|nr:cysteine desulfurase family protein [Alkalibaculum sporogenes]MPW27127.1 aminotransferase class V-fold PLP-dependent enzyme [Alkalibaculum sporogenes]